MSFSLVEGVWSAGRRVRNSMAFRSGPAYQRALRMIPPPRLSSKAALDLPLLTACGRKHLPMLEQALYSVAVHWSRLPAVTVVSDGTISEAAIEQKLRWWPAGLEVKSWKDFVEYHREKGRDALVRYAEKDAFGRKLAAILAMSERQRTLWCDCDILFFADFTPLLEMGFPPPPFLVTSEDWLYGYDGTLTETTQAHLKTIPAVNTGFDIFEGNLYDSCEMKPLIEEALDTCNVFTEQTILAEAVYRRGRIGWGLDIIRIFVDDVHTLKPTFLRQRWMARHYISPVRHLFWRDALASRLGLR